MQEQEALINFYNDFNGPNWRIADNWLDGDPCINQWYGVQCNVKGEVIALHFFENHLIGSFHQSIANLTNLMHLSIFNGDLEYEGEINRNANEINMLIDEVWSLTNLEEINLCKVKMKGRLSGNSDKTMHNLTKLRFINLSNNEIDGQIPNGE